jgi:hypothetical protein
MTDNPAPQNPSEEKAKPRPVGPRATVLIAGYLVLLVLALLWALMYFWPTKGTAGRQTESTEKTNAAIADTAGSAADTGGAAPDVAANPTNAEEAAAESAGAPEGTQETGEAAGGPSDFRLLLIVALAGALGSTLHSLRSFYWYVGQGELVWRWVAKYVLLPFVGATIALVFYLVIRGGLFSTQGSTELVSPYGFAALAALVGLFSEQAVLKLKEIAENIFTKPAPGNNSVPQEPPPSE